MEKRIIEKESYNFKATNDEKNVETEEKLKDLGTNFYILMHSVDDLERTTNFLTNSLDNLKEEISVRCDYCEDIFLSESNIRTHIVNKHGTNPEHSCTT